MHKENIVGADDGLISIWDLDTTPSPRPGQERDDLTLPRHARRGNRCAACCRRVITVQSYFASGV